MSALVLFAHPHASKSVTTRGLLSVLASRRDVAVRDLYDLYPDYDIDVPAEQRAVEAATTLILLSPVNWYSVPALQKHWLDVVLTHGWAHGREARALRGKALWWVTSAGADRRAYTPDGGHRRRFEDFVAPLEQTARFCGMRWLPPFVVYAGSHASEAERGATRVELLALCDSHLGTESVAAAP